MAEPTRVDIPGVGTVEFPDSMTPDQVNAAAAKLYQEHQPAPPSAARRFGEGVLRTLPQVQKLPGMLQSAYEHPEQIPGAVTNVARNIGRAQLSPGASLPIIGPLLGSSVDQAAAETAKGNVAGGVGEVAGITGQLAAGLPFRGSETLGGAPVAELKAAGVGDQSLNLMRQRGSNVLPMPPPRGVLRTTAEPPPMQGNLALKLSPTPEPTPAPLATPNAMRPPAAASAGGTLSPEQMRQLPSYSEQMRRPDLYGEMGAKWSAGAEPGTADASQAAGSHKYLGEMDARLKYLLASDQGYVSSRLLRAMGLPWEVAKYPIAHHYGGNLGVAGMAGADVVRVLASHPQLMRDALLANLATQGRQP